MHATLTIFLLTLFITSVLMTVATLISKKSIIDREKSSPFECGFDPKSSPRTSFSIRFFLIALIFLIFDVEITLLLPIANTIPLSNPTMWSLTSLMFLLILLIGLYHEWNQGSLNWAY